MKIKLFSINTSPVYTNNGIEYLTRYLRNSFTNDTIQSFFYCNDDYIKIYNDIDEYTKIYGFSVFSTNYKICTKICKHIKDNNPKAITIFGGQFVTMNYLEIINTVENVDYIILGDGEKPLESLIEWHKSNNSTFQHENVVSYDDIYNKSINIETDIDRPHSYDFYLSDPYSNNIFKTHSLFTKSNVCAGSCSFCCSRKGKINYRCSEKIYEEISYVHNKYKIRDFWITDDDIFDVDNDYNRMRLESLFDIIIKNKLNIGISAFSKSKSICNSKNHRLLLKMSQAGMHHIFLGIDGANEDDIALYHKLSTLEQGLEAIKILEDSNIGVRYGIIFLNPYTTLKKMENSFYFLKKAKSSNYYHYGGLRVQLLNNTRLFKKVKNDGLLKDDFSFINNDSYTFMDKDIEPIVNILNIIMPRLDNIVDQFNIFKNKYEIAIHLNKSALYYKYIFNKYKQIEFDELIHYFEMLYVHHDYKYCLHNIDKFVDKMLCRAQIYKPIISELNEMIYG